MTIDVSLFVILVVIAVAMTVFTVVLFMLRSGQLQTIASMSETINQVARENANLRVQNTALEKNVVLLAEGKTLAEQMATALGEATRIETMRHEATLRSGTNLYSVLGAALAFKQVEPQDVVNILMDLEVGEQAFVAALLNSYFGWPGPAVGETDYTPESEARAALIRDALGMGVTL